MAWIYSGGLTDTSFTSGPTTSGWAPAQFVYGGQLTVATDSTATQMRVRVENGDVANAYGMKFGLYSGSTLVVQATGTLAAGATAQWLESSTFSEAVSAGTYTVLVSCANNDGAEYYYNTGGSGSYASEAYATAMASTETISHDDSGFLYGVGLNVEAAAGSVGLLPVLKQNFRNMGYS